MILTKEQLKQIIEEEIKGAVDESELDEGAYDWMPFGSQASKMQKAVEKSRTEHFPTSAEKATQSAESDIDALLSNFKQGLMKILTPQMAESTDDPATEEVTEESSKELKETEEAEE